MENEPQEKQPGGIPQETPTSTVLPRVQPKRKMRQMTSDEQYIVDQLVKFPRDARALKDAIEQRRRNSCRLIAQAISDGTLQVIHVDELRRQNKFLDFAEQQLRDANTMMAHLVGKKRIVITDDELMQIPTDAQLMLARDPAKKCVTIWVKEEAPVGQAVEVEPRSADAASGPPRQDAAALSGTSDQSGSAVPSDERQAAPPLGLPPRPSPEA